MMSFEKMSILEAYLVNLSGRKSGIPENVIISLERVILGKRMSYSCSVAQFTLEKSNKTPFTEPTLKFVTQCYRYRLQKYPLTVKRFVEASEASVWDNQGIHITL